MQGHDSSPARLPNTRKDLGIRRTCQNCGAEFAPKRQTLGLFCSRGCYREWWAKARQPELSRQGLRRLDALRAAGRDPRATQEATWKRRMAFRNSALTLAEKDKEATDDEAWAERGSYWQHQVDPEERPFSPWDRKREHKPLILSGHGVRLRIRHGALEVRHGRTHYPQAPRTDLFWPGDRRMPSRILLIDVDGMVTFDVVEFLSRQHVPLVVLDYRGRVVSTLGGTPASTDLTLREAQLAALTNGVGVRLSALLIRDKLQGSISTLRSLPPSPRVQSGIRRLGEALTELRENEPEDVESVRMIEARGASAYFSAWLHVPVRWKGTGRHPIPPEWRRMPLRSSLLGDRNRNATHPITAALNYAFAVLESQVRAEALAAGLDITIGYLHASRPGRPALVFDLMEPLRPTAERAILDLVQAHAFAPGDVFLTERGICRLHPQLARAVAAGLAEEPRIAGLVQRISEAPTGMCQRGA
jgi:CRISPR-associated protein Cas1